MIDSLNPSDLLALLQSQTSLERLASTVLDLAIEKTDAQRAYLILGDSFDEIELRAGRTADQQDAMIDSFVGSTSVVKKVMETLEPLYIPALPADVAFSGSPSVRAGQLQSVICIPLFRPGSNKNLVGTLYVDSTTPVRPLLTENHLALLQGIANQLAVSIENARLFQEIEKKNKTIAELNTKLEQRVETQEGKLLQMEALLDESQRELGKRSGLDNIIGRSNAMQNIFRIVQKIAQTNSPVLIRGESGTGKELIARTIHFRSSRSGKPIVSVNCAAFNDTLLESELFGHRKGAFTGADHHKMGLFQLADCGTLFLDELGDMSMEMQKKLLRVLQNGEVRPIGSEDTYHVDVRIIAATHQDLPALITEGKFREDLYFRLNVLQIVLPPLRERREDLPLLIEHFAQQIAAELQKTLTAPSGKILEHFLTHEWPGNVRELENELRRYFILESDYNMDAIPARQRGASNSLDLNTVERETIRKALESSQGNKTRAAEILGIPLRTLYDRIKKHSLE